MNKIQRFIMLVRIGMAIVVVALVLSQIVTQFVFYHITTEKELVILLNSREQHTTEMRQATLDYITDPTDANHTLLQTKYDNWVHENDLLFAGMSSYPSDVAAHIATASNAATGIQDQTNIILIIPRTSNYATSYNVQTKYVGQYNIIMAQTEDSILAQNLLDMQTAAITNIALFLLVMGVFIAEYFAAFHPAIQDLRAIDKKVLSDEP